MQSALIISDSAKATEFYRDFLKKYGYTDIKTALDGESAKRKLVESDFDLILINTPLGGSMCERLSQELAEKNRGQVILFVKAERMAVMTESVEDYGVLTIEKPINLQIFWSALKFAKVASGRIKVSEAKIRRLQKQLAENKVISRAKCVLIEKEGYSEAEAHRYIEKQAMNQRVSRVEIAEEVLDYYG